jgi:hypothetical protein
MWARAIDAGAPSIEHHTHRPGSRVPDQTEAILGVPASS